jgi:hypothetical protein
MKSSDGGPLPQGGDRSAQQACNFERRHKSASSCAPVRLTKATRLITKEIYRVR